MNPPKRLLALVLCLAATVCLPLAAKPKPKKSPAPAVSPKPSPTPTPTSTPEPDPANIRIDVLIVSMPEDKFLTLLPDLLDKEKIEKAVPDLLDAVKRKEMILEGFPVITTKSGQRAVVETVKEVRYATEEWPTDETSAADTSSGTDQSGSASPSPSPAATPAPSASPTPTPAAEIDFETRNAGVTLEVEPVLSADKEFIDLNLASQHVQFLGFTNPLDAGKQTELLKEDAKKTDMSQPLFHTMKDTTSVTLRSGQHLLLGVHKSPQPEGYVEIFIIHAEVLDATK